MAHHQHMLSIQAPAQGLLEITDQISKWVAHESVTVGMLTVFIRHTSASILIQENADPDVLRDMEDFFANLVPEDISLYRHIAEGADDMPAHIKGAMTQTSLSIPVNRGKMLLGTWQGIFLFEHRQTPRPREIVLHLDGN
ncbi:MAG: YjbQ family protein [Rhodospirillaceae bacterium]|jgi:secondary thiamine-phosphate synthase enzyme|nr:YjbQ family protein [Rhodospirillaceae bacterium]